MNFKLWMENTQVSIDDSRFKVAIQKQAERNIDLLRDHADEVSRFDADRFLQSISTEYSNYPQLKNLLNALHSKNIRYIFDQQNKLRNWLQSQPYNKQTRDLSRQIYTYVDKFVKNDLQQAEQNVWQQVKAALDGTAVKMNELKQLIDSSITRIVHWNGSAVIIKPATQQNEFNQVAIEPTDSAEIYLGTNDFAPEFMIYNHDGKLEIDDVLEGGDTDFFNSPQIQADYFNLINELKKPGSTNKGKIITLYTARPRKDREQLLAAKTLPVNIFLANNYDHVEGISQDLAQGGQSRDIWKVRINSQYLTQTLDGKIQYYQVTVPNAPVVSMELL